MKRPFITFFTILISLTSFLAAIPLIGTASATPVWTSASPLEQSTGTNQYPAALQASDGKIWLAWSLHSPTGLQQRLFYATLVRNGGVWVNTTRTPRTTGTREITPSLAQLDANTILLYWASNQTVYYNIVYREYFLNNATWSGTFNATNTTANDTFPSVAVARDGTLWLFWTRTDATGVGQIYYKTMKNNVWSTETPLTSGTNTNWEPSAIVGRDGRIMLAYANGPQDLFQILYNSYGPTGWGTPQAATPVPAAGYMDQHPTLVQDRNGTAWLFWDRTIPVGTNFEQHIFAKSDPNYGQNWLADPETQLTFGHGTQLYIDQQPVAIQSARDKSVWVVYSTNTANKGEFDLYLVTAKIAPVHDLRVVTVTTAPSQCLVGITYVCFNTNPLEIYAGGFTNNYAVCSGPPIYNCPVSQSPNVTLSILLWNLGDYNETTTLAVKTTGSVSLPVSTQILTVFAGNQSTPIVNWSTTTVPPGHYGFFVNASIPVQPALNKPDNLLTTTNQVWLLPLGDIDQDGSVTITDISVVFYNYGFSCFDVGSCSPRYIAAQWGDVDGNGIIDVVDAGILVHNYGIYT